MKLLGPRRHYPLLGRFFGDKAKEKPNAKQEKWNTVVGLEIHAQISSKSKLFSGSSTKYGSPVNSCVSFFDCATPGTLPVLNKRCIEAGVLTALALSCKVNEISLFDRKHYFYADLPSGYQITQQHKPLASDGIINFNVFTPGVHKESYSKSSRLKQIQLEQDSGKSLHDHAYKISLIDLNRAGIPLMEFVFEPDLSDGEEAAALVKELKLILERLDTCSCRMDEGALRIDANVSINKRGEPLGPRTEIKNIFSVRAVASAINYEIKRQIKEREKGNMIVNETRSWDTESGKTVVMRDKEDKQDYRFMPEPNLPPLHIHVDEHSENKYNLVDVPYLKSTIPEMPQETRNKLAAVYNVHKSLIFILVNEPILLKMFFHIVDGNKKLTPQVVAKTLIYQLLEFLYKNKLNLEFGYSIRDHVGELIDLLESNTINIIIFQKVLELVSKDPANFPRQIVKQNNWSCINDEEELRKLCQDVFDKYSIKYKECKETKKDKTKYINFFLKQAIKMSNERVNLKRAKAVLQEMLD